MSRAHDVTLRKEAYFKFTETGFPEDKGSPSERAVDFGIGSLLLDATGSSSTLRLLAGGSTSFEGSPEIREKES